MPNQSPGGASAVGERSRSTKTRRSERRGRFAPESGLRRVLWVVTSYLVTHMTATVFWVLFRVLNRTTFRGREHVDGQPNTLLLSNHQSMIDSFLVAMVFFAGSWTRPHLLPWNPAAEENFYSNPLLAWFSRHWRCIPVREGRRDLHALHRMIGVLPKGVMTLFPEGTRTRDGSVGRGRPGAGLVILGTRPKVIPVAIDGMNEVLPIGSYRPRIGKRIYVTYGPPVDYSEFLGQPRTRDMAQAVVDRVTTAIQSQLEEIRRLREDARPRTSMG